MAASDTLNSIYERAESFGRDVFHYVVTGTMFAIVSSMPWWSEIPWWWIREWNQFTLLLVAAIVTFSLGHGLLAIGFWIRNKIIPPDDPSSDGRSTSIFVCLFGCRDAVVKYNSAIDHTRKISKDELDIENESDRNAHIGLEMSVLVKQPRLHAVFVERYNALWHLRLGLAAAFLSAGAVNLAHAICSLLHSLLRAIYTPNECCQGVVVLVAGSIIGLISIGIGWQLMRQHLTTNTNFLQRVLVAFNISERKNA